LLDSLLQEINNVLLPIPRMQGAIIIGTESSKSPHKRTARGSVCPGSGVDQAELLTQRHRLRSLHRPTSSRYQGLCCSREQLVSGARGRPSWPACGLFTVLPPLDSKDFFAVAGSSLCPGPGVGQADLPVEYSPSYQLWIARSYRWKVSARVRAVLSWRIPITSPSSTWWRRSSRDRWWPVFSQVC